MKTCITYGMLENCGIQSANEDTESNPTGDKRTTPNSWPWLVRLVTTDSEGNENYWCSGTLVSREWIVIAAHCFTDNGWVVVSGRLSTPEETIGTTLYAYLGNHRQSVDHGTDEKHLIKTVFINTYYEAFESDKGNDMALLQLAKPAELRKEVNYACVARQHIEFENGTQCYAVGWGQMPSNIESNTKINSHAISHGPFNTTDINADNQLLSISNTSESVELQEVIMPIMSASKCLEYYGKHQTESQFCAGWRLKDSCERDCRSALYCKIPYTNKWLLAGVRNYGTETEYRPGTGIYTSAITRNEWIWSRIGNLPI
ncbi:unnamed protein product [Dicrocoelium dendriticum]|nr:unnamed protein product [Dicrocoelium dendriticum]